MTVGGFTQRRGRSQVHLLRHLLEMALAMMVGMFAGAAVFVSALGVFLLSRSYMYARVQEVNRPWVGSPETGRLDQCYLSAHSRSASRSIRSRRS